MIEIIKNRYGSERVMEKISPTKIRVMGESLMSRASADENGNQTMFDFEGGPCYNVGAKLTFGKYKWKIISITPEVTEKENLASVILEVAL